MLTMLLPYLTGLGVLLLAYFGGTYYLRGRHIEELKQAKEVADRDNRTLQNIVEVHKKAEVLQEKFNEISTTVNRESGTDSQRRLRDNFTRDSDSGSKKL